MQVYSRESLGFLEKKYLLAVIIYLLKGNQIIPAVTERDGHGQHCLQLRVGGLSKGAGKGGSDISCGPIHFPARRAAAKLPKRKKV